MITLCSDGHDEVAFEGSRCPLCDMRSDLQAEITDLQNETSSLERIIEERDSQIEELEQKLGRAQEELEHAERQIYQLKSSSMPYG